MIKGLTTGDERDGRVRRGGVERRTDGRGPERSQTEERGLPDAGRWPEAGRSCTRRQRAVPCSAPTGKAECRTPEKCRLCNDDTPPQERV